MADFVFRGFLHAAYLTAEKKWDDALTVLEEVMKSNFSLTKDGNRTMISSSVGGKEFRYQIPQGMEAHQVTALAQRCWGFISRSTDDQLKNFLEGRIPVAIGIDFSRCSHI